MKQLKKSKYAFFVKKRNGNYVVYSSLSGAVILFNQKRYIKMLEAILEKDLFDYRDNKFIDLLLQKQIIMDNCTNEDLLVRGKYEESIIRSRRLEIMLIVTRQCNFRCVYCGQPHRNENMADETYESILKFIENQIITYGYTSVQVTFFGGEPLLQSENICLFLEKLRLLLQRLSTHEKTYTFEAGMSTNGYLLTPDIFERLTKLNCNFFQISIDGMPEIHNSLRPLASGQPTWNRIMDNLLYMVSTDAQFSVLLRTNFNLEVAESLVEFYKFVGEEINDKRISLYYETIKNQGNMKTPETVCGIEELVLDFDIVELIRENNLRCMNSTSRLFPGSRACYASKPNFYVVDEKSQVLKCSFALDSPINVIGVLDKNGNYVQKTDLYFEWVYRDYLTSEKCKECKALPLCFGKCCPKTLMQRGEMQCNVEIVKAEIEGLLDNYYS